MRNRNDTILRSIMYVTWTKQVPQFRERDELLFRHAYTAFPDTETSYIAQPGELVSVWNTFTIVGSWIRFAQTLPNPCDGREMAQKIRAVLSKVDNGSMSASACLGQPDALDVAVHVWSETDERFTTLIKYNRTAKEFDWFSLDVNDWPFPLLYRLKLCLADQGAGCGPEQPFAIPVELSADAMVLLLLVPLGAAILYRKQKITRTLKQQWCISASDLHFGDRLGDDSLSPGVGDLHGMPVWTIPVIRKAARTSARVETSIAALLLELHSIHHDNIQRLLGLCSTPQYIWIVVPLVKRGTLEMLMAVMELDWDFRLSFISDIMQGLSYIHNSSLKYHGNLSERTCLIDSRFVVKIACLGFEQIKAVVSPTRQSRKVKPVHFNVYQKTDILSFHALVILLSKYVPMDLTHVGAPQSFNLRKRMEIFGSEIENCHCMENVEQKFRETFPGRRKNPIESVLDRLEGYTDTLEKAVQSRTEELAVEQDRCNQLLEQILPRPVVQALRSNIYVKPELFECVSICFTDLPGSVAWIATVSSSKVINLLHAVYLMFDEEISKYDVHKIETIGDTYMVASGIPVRNGIQHVTAICRMAKSMMDRFGTFCLPKGTHMQLRAGIHSGPCAAGVVGHKLPRYCLFGDAVNTSSRMTTHGEPGRIHASENTILLIPKDAMDVVYINRGEIFVKGKGQMSTYWIV
ncbi:guanylate cyclase 2D-like [Paramacrobiotus metropolitanus]|uniref:guanylate cyclase 2D-like n=1 Tax=Paramacrobiotus metropolitanus TaxID=2943436 RepID=UPI002445FA41|nr:guanylate cyclase 2D-like [Paramacrobiotus metropolitanus]